MFYPKCYVYIQGNVPNEVRWRLLFNSLYNTIGKKKTNVNTVQSQNILNDTKGICLLRSTTQWPSIDMSKIETVTEISIVLYINRKEEKKCKHIALSI